MRAAEIRKEANYAGIRVLLLGLLRNARCKVQVDVGFGDAVVPGPEEARYPIILDGLPEPRIRVYPRDTVVAEKLPTTQPKWSICAICTRHRGRRFRPRSGAPRILLWREVGPATIVQIAADRFPVRTVGIPR